MLFTLVSRLLIIWIFVVVVVLRERLKNKSKLSEEIVSESALDFEDRWEKEFKSFQFAERVTPDSEKKNYKNINRIMDKKVILLVKNKQTNTWEFPIAEWKNEKSLREVYWNYYYYC